MPEVLQHALSLLFIGLRSSFNFQPCLQLRLENIFLTIKILHISNELLLICWLIFDNPRIVPSERELSHVCVESAYPAKPIFSECIDHYFLLSFFLDALREFNFVFIQFFFVWGLWFFLRIYFDVLLEYINFLDFILVFFLICMI